MLLIKKKIKILKRNKVRKQTAKKKHLRETKAGDGIMSELKPYPKYKDSGVEWIGEIPEGWEKVKLSWLFNEIGSGSTPNSNNESYYKNGCINWINTGDLNDNYLSETKNKITQFALDKLSTIRIYPKNSLVVAMYGATIGKLAITKIEAATNQACCVLTNPRNTNIKFIFYWFLANRENIINLASGGGQPNISQSLIKSLHVYLPKTVSEQNNIVKYLDKRIKQINSLIFDKKHLIKLLEEKRQAVITETVTTGLDPNVKMKNSGIEWIGEIPKHWDIIKLKYLFNIINGGTPKSSEASYWSENNEGIVWITPQDLSSDGYSFSASERKITIQGLLNSSANLVKKGSIAISTRAPIGSMKISDIDYTTNQGCRSLEKISDDVIEYFFFYLLNSHKEVLQSLGQGTTFLELSTRDLKEFLVPFPSKEEQQQTAEKIGSYNFKLDKTIGKIKQQISNLKEYRESLIYEAVTGKIDLRNYEPKGDIDEAH